MNVNVGVIGAGGVGKRVADAIDNMPDMNLVGIADTNIYAATRNTGGRHNLYQVSSNGNGTIAVDGTLDDLLSKTDIIVDATPKGIPPKNFSRYRDHKVKIIVQGGEPHSLTDLSFNTFGNYQENFKADATRVGSCNTSALLRMLVTAHHAYVVKDWDAHLDRRGSDPAQGGEKGPTNAIVPVLGGSHHYQDVWTCSEELDGIGFSTAVATPHTLSHFHRLRIELKEEVDVDTLLNLYAGTPRIRVIYGKETGITDTAKVAEMYKDMLRPRGDHPEVTIWADGAFRNGNSIYIFYDVHMESVIIPPTIDAIRALTGIEKDAWESAYKTDINIGHTNFAKDKDLYVPVTDRLEVIDRGVQIVQIQQTTHTS